MRYYGRFMLMTTLGSAYTCSSEYHHIFIFIWKSAEELNVVKLKIYGGWYWLVCNLSFYFSRWGSGEPNNHLNQERCGEICCPHYFNDKSCETKINYICELNKGKNLIEFVFQYTFIYQFYLCHDKYWEFFVRITFNEYTR
jgi:hypothetical protein